MIIPADAADVDVENTEIIFFMEKKQLNDEGGVVKVEAMDIVGEGEVVGDLQLTADNVHFAIRSIKCVQENRMAIQLFLTILFDPVILSPLLFQ